jgi:hypothetical protein
MTPPLKQLAFSTWPERHRVDHQLAGIGRDHDELEQVAGPGGTDHEKARRIVPELDPRDGVPVGMIDVIGVDVPSG